MPSDNAAIVLEMLERFGPGDDVPWAYVQALLDCSDRYKVIPDAGDGQPAITLNEGAPDAVC